jgi:hypothetical protein
MGTPLHAVDANEATRTVLCKEPGCEEVADASRGPYALLCHRHARVKKEQRLKEPSPRAPAPLRSGTPIGFAARAQQLVALGKNLDRKLDKLKPAQEEARAAMACLDLAHGNPLDALWLAIVATAAGARVA